MGFFSVDGHLYRFIARFWDMIKLNFFWLLCSLPIVTMGASTAAAFTITLKMVDDQEGYIAKDFFPAFKANLKQGSIMGILLLLAMIALWLDFQFFNLLENNPIIFLIMGFLGLFIFTLTFLYAFPLLARYQNTIPNIMRNSFDISIRYFVRTLLLIILLVFEILICLWNEWTLIVAALIGPACIFLTISGFALRIFRELDKEAQT